MKKTTLRSTPSPLAALEAVVGGVRTQIIDLGDSSTSADQESDIRAQIVDLG